MRLGQFGKDDDDDAVMGIVLMRRNENPSKVVERLYKKLPDIKASLPEGIKLEKLYDRQELVNHTIETVFHNVFEGITLVVIVLIVFLFDLPSGLIASMAIPLSLCLALMLLNISHISANLLSQGAIDFGIIVDGAVVMVENAFAQLSHLPADATQGRAKGAGTALRPTGGHTDSVCYYDHHGRLFAHFYFRRCGRQIVQTARFHNELLSHWCNCFGPFYHPQFDRHLPYQKTSQTSGKPRHHLRSLDLQTGSGLVSAPQ